MNAGSTSLKLERYELNPARAMLADPLTPTAACQANLEDAEGALAALAVEPLDAVAHRLVRVPEGMGAVLRLDARSVDRIAAVGADAPLHDATALRAVRIIANLLPDIPQFAVSDSAFHRTMPLAATTYALPRELTQAGLRRIGYHGLSHEYAASRGCALAKLDVRHARVISAHLGGGSSVCAIRNGESLDTTMGYTPLEGLPMATRSGSVDPGLLIHLLRSGTSVDELEETLERRSGLLGISGFSADVRELLAAGNNPDVQLALAVLGWRLRSSLGAMLAVLGGANLIVFTGGIGEHAPQIRTAALDGGLGAGALLDEQRNTVVTEGRIDGEASAVKVVVVAAREGWQLARVTGRALEFQ